MEDYSDSYILCKLVGFAAVDIAEDIVAEDIAEEDIVVAGDTVD